MKLIACLSWYDEDPGWLAELVASMALAGVNHVVAVDGAYALYPQAAGGSPSEQADAIFHAARGGGMGVTIHTPDHPWVGNECEKRSFAFALAHQVADWRDAWLWVCDADEVILQADGLRAQLEGSVAGVGEVLLVEYEGASPIRKLFRAHPGGIRVTGSHRTYVNGDGRRLWGWPEGLEPTDTFWDVKVLHRPHSRPPARTAAKERYYDLRDRLGLESEHAAAA